MNSKESRVNFKSIMIKKPRYFKLKSQANNTIWLNLFTFNIKQASIFLIVHTTVFNNIPNTLQVFLKQANIFLFRKHPKKRKKNDADRFSLYRCKHFFLFNNNPHTTLPFKKSIKTLLFLQLLQLQPSVIKIMFSYRIVFCVFIDSRNASIITFFRIF